MQKGHVQVILGRISSHRNDILPVIPSKRCYYVMALDKNWTIVFVSLYFVFFVVLLFAIADLTYLVPVKNRKYFSNLNLKIQLIKSYLRIEC